MRNIGRREFVISRPKISWSKVTVRFKKSNLRSIEKYFLRFIYGGFLIGIYSIFHLPCFGNVFNSDQKMNITEMLK